MPAFNLGEWLPDQQPIALPGLLEVVNVYPTLTGYQSLNGGSPLTDLTSLTNEVKGAFAGDTQKGVHFILAGDGIGTDSKLQIIYSSGDWVDISPTGTEADIASAGKWSFSVYGNRIIATGRDTDVLSVDTTTYDPSGSNRFATVAAAASKADVCAVFKDFLILGNIVGQGANASAVGTQRAGLHWSGIGDPTNWPTIGTQAAIDTQSDFQVLDGDGGEITAIVPAGEYCAVFRENQVWRMDYVGGGAFFSFRKMDSQRGCIIPGCAVAVGGVVYFPSAEGFMAFDGSEMVPIGEEKIDRTWRETMDFNAKPRVNAVYQAESEAIFWTVATGSGTPTLIYGYRHGLGRWFSIEGESAAWILDTSASVTGGSLDGVPFDDYNMDNCDPDNWVVATAYDEGDVVKSILSGQITHVYICTTAGTSDATTCPLTGTGTAISDGSAVWDYSYEVNADVALQDNNLDQIGVRDGDRALAMFNSGGDLMVYNDSATPLHGQITTGDFETPEGQRGVLRWIRPVYDGLGNFSGQASGRINPNDPVDYIPLTWKDSVGVLSVKSSGAGGPGSVPQRVGGRYIRAEFSFDTPVTKFSGFDVELRSTVRPQRATR